MKSKMIKSFINRSCKYKKKISSLKDSLIYLLELRSKQVNVDSCYKCIFCGNYHIGHYGKKQTRKKNRKIIKEYLIREKRKEILKCVK